MSLMVMAGMTRELASWLEDRLTGVPVRSALNGQETLDEVAKGGCSLLIIDHGISGPTAPEVLKHIREELGMSQLPVIYCILPDMATGTPGETAQELANKLGVDHVLVHPIDREEMAQQAARLLELPPDSSEAAGAAGAQKQQAMSATMTRIWEQTKAAVMNRLEVLEQATAALLEGNLDDELRRLAEGEAHKLGGLVGTFGYLEASRLAQEAERIFEAESPLGQAEALSLSELVVSLRDEVEQPLDLGIYAEPDQADKPPIPAAGPFVLVVDDDTELAQLVAGEAAARGMRAEVALDPDKARDIISRSRPDAVLLDLTFPEGTEDSLALLSELSEAKPPVPVLVLTGRDTFIDRVDVARRGGRGFLAKSLPLAQVLDAVTELMDKLPEVETNVIIVDDDPDLLIVVESLLEGEGFRVKTVDDPRQFWSTLEASPPQVLILDVDMPHIDGIELCRVVRNDPKWGGLPVMFITASTDADVMTRAFAAGADDFLNERLVNDELVPRIAHRLSSIRSRGASPKVYSAVGTSSTPAEDVETFDVVLVDDDEALASVVLHSLETRGYSAKCLPDGGDAADALGGADATLRARLVLLDVNLPGLNGLDVLRRLNHDSVLQHTRVIMLTARSAESEVLEALELGAYDFVAKPFSLQLLMQRVRRALLA